MSFTNYQGNEAPIDLWLHFKAHQGTAAFHQEGVVSFSPMKRETEVNDV
jgi:hypothetical protein